MSVELREGIKLLKFAEETADETRWQGEECLMWIQYELIEEFIELFPDPFEESSSIVGNLQTDCICIDLMLIFDKIDLETLFPKD